MTTTPRALVIGEALVDVVRRTDGSVAEHPGGSPANVAVGLSRLGRSADLLTWLAADEHGDLVRAHLASNGVHVLAGDRAPRSTSVAVANIDPTGAATYEFDLEWDIARPTDEADGEPVVVHTGSIAAVLSPGAAKVSRVLNERRASATITYDPNLRPALMGSNVGTRPLVEALISTADVVKVSDEDLGWLHPGVDAAEIMQAWSLLGPAIVVVTRGGDGAIARTAGGELLTIPGITVDVKDTVGAGDSFMSGLIDGLWSAGLLGAANRAALHAITADTLRPILERCGRIGAITVSRAGANPPTLAELGEA